MKAGFMLQLHKPLKNCKKTFKTSFKAALNSILLINLFIGPYRFQFTMFSKSSVTKS